MTKMDPSVRKKLLEQRERNKRTGVVIDNRDVNKITIRVLPRHGEEIGKEHFSVYCEEMKKSVTCPRTYGKPDPLLDYLESTRRSGTKEAKDHAFGYVTRSEEYWMPVIVRGDEGTPEAPNMRIFRAKKSVYDEILNWVLSDDLGSEDISDSREGRDIFIEKKGEGRKTKWTAERLDKSLLSKSKALRIALVKASKAFDPTAHFFSFDLAEYEECYQGLTGEELPEDIKEELAEIDGREDSDGDDRKKSKPKAVSKKKRDEDEEESDVDAEDDEEESDEEESDEEESDEEESDEDEEESDEDEEEESDEDEEEESDEEESDEDEEEESDEEDPEEVEPTVRGGKVKPGKSVKVKPGKSVKVKPGKSKPKVLPRKPKANTKSKKGKVGSKIRGNR